MGHLSNKSLAVLLLLAIVVSTSGTVFTLLRFEQLGATTPVGNFVQSDSSGVANFSIQSSFSIHFVNALIPFGTGSINGTYTSCVMGTNGTPPSSVTTGCVGFNTTVDQANLTIINDGNTKANVSLNFTKNATTFIGGTTPLFMYQVINAQSGACTTIANGSSMQTVGAIEVNGSNARVCTNLATTNGQNTIAVGVFIKIPQDAALGSHSVTVTAIGCDDGSC